MTGTMRFRPVRPHHRAVPKVWTATFVVWCVAMVLVAIAGGVALGLSLSGG